MKLSYDPKRNVAYIRFHEKLGQVTALEISDDVNIDTAPDGTVYGIELLNANEQLTGDHGACTAIDANIAKERSSHARWNVSPSSMSRDSLFWKT